MAVVLSGWHHLFHLAHYEPDNDAMNYMQPLIFDPVQMGEVVAASQLLYEAMRGGDNRPYVGTVELRLELKCYPDGSTQLCAIAVDELRR